MDARYAIALFFASDCSFPTRGADALSTGTDLQNGAAEKSESARADAFKMNCDAVCPARYFPSASASSPTVSRKTLRAFLTVSGEVRSIPATFSSSSG